MTARQRILVLLEYREEYASDKDIAAELELRLPFARATLAEMHANGEITRTAKGLYGPAPKRSGG